MQNQKQLRQEFNRQLQNLINRGYPKLTHLSEETFRGKLTALLPKLEGIQMPEIDLEMGRLPFVIVIHSDSATAENMMELVERDGKKGVTILRPHTSKNFTTINEVIIPNELAYALIDIDRGKETINLPPSEAIKLIRGDGRSALTIDEGIAIVTHYPEFLRKNNCFSLLASRTGADTRVPAIWINAKKEPNLGWCWDGNPHTWLGSASCFQRLA